MRALTLAQALAVFDQDASGMPHAQMLELTGALSDLAAATGTTICETGPIPGSTDED